MRQNALMTPVAQTLTDDQIIALSNHYATLTRSTLDRRLEVQADHRIDRLVRTGGTARGIPGCQPCHGTGAGGPVETPTISGQFQQYLALQLTNYASGARRNDVFSRMRDIASKLTDEEVRLLYGFCAEQQIVEFV